MVLAALTSSLILKQIVLFEALSVFIYVWKPRRALQMIGIAFGVIALTFTPYLDGWRSIIDHVIRYTSVISQYGLNLIFPVGFVALLMWIIMLLLPWYLRYSRHVPIYPALLIVALAHTTFSYNAIIYYLIIPVPFGFLAGQIWRTYAYSLLGGIGMLFDSLLPNFQPLPLNMLWLCAVVWLILNLKESVYDRARLEHKAAS